MAEVIEGWEWTRPQGLLALALPLLVLLTARFLRRPLPAYTGTLVLWRRVARERASSALRSFRVPLSLLLLLAALTAGAVALAGPRRVQGKAPARLRVLVDASPSMYLEHSPGETRLARALTAVQRILDEGTFDEVEWLRFVDGDLEESASFPPEWHVAPRVPQPEPPFSDWDVDGVLFVTDHDVGRERAGLVASGGPAVHGPVAAEGTTRIDWDGEELVPVDDALGPLSVRVAPDVPDPVRAVARAWAEERGLDLTTEDAPGTLLDVTRAASFSARPGHVDVAPTEIDDPASFAVSWARVFDDHVLPAPGVVTLDERVDAGSSVVVDPRREARTERRAGTSLDAWLALAAAVLAVASLFVRR